MLRIAGENGKVQLRLENRGDSELEIDELLTYISNVVFLENFPDTREVEILTAVLSFSLFVFVVHSSEAIALHH